MEIIQEFNEIYEGVFTTRARTIDIWGGRGRGGSHFATDYFLHKITQPNYFRGYFVRQAFSDIRDSLFRDFKDRIEENETVSIDDFAIQENEMRILYKPTGNLIISKGVKKDGNRTAKMKSLAGATHVIVEECEELGEDDYDQMDLSLRTTKADIQVIRVFNPPHKQHWIFRDYTLIDAEQPADWPGDRKFTYYKAIPKTDANLFSVHSTYVDNIRNIDASTIEKFEGFKKRKPEYYYTVIKGLVSEGSKGRIFSGWEPITDEQFNAIDARSIIGIDFGSATGGIVEEKIVNDRVYLRQLSYGGLTIKQTALKLAKLGIKDHVVIADSAEPQSISQLRNGWQKKDLSEQEIEEWFTVETDSRGNKTEICKYPVLLSGFNIFGVIKRPGYRAFARKEMMDMQVFVTEGSTDLWNEYREHKWALDKNKNPTDEPEDGNDHLIDPSLYVLTSKGRYY